MVSASLLAPTNSASNGILEEALYLQGSRPRPRECLHSVRGAYAWWRLHLKDKVRSTSIQQTGTSDASCMVLIRRYSWCVGVSFFFSTRGFSELFFLTRRARSG